MPVTKTHAVETNLMTNTQASVPSSLSRTKKEGGGNRIPISSLYCLKALCALFIVGLHCPIFGQEWLDPVLRTAVPVFFMISGFFLYNDDRTQAIRHCQKACWKTIRLTIIANLIYFILNNLTYTVFYKPLTTPASWIQFLVFGSNMNFAFWYLNAYIETLLIFILCLYTRTDRLLLIGIPFFLLCNLLIGKYGFVIGHHVWFHRNFITVGIPFIGLGWLLRKYQHDILKIISGKCSLFLFAISTLLVYAEALILKMAKVVNGGDTYFFTIPMVICMFIFCLHHPSAGSESLLETTGKKYSLDIYIYHVLVYVLLVKITTYLHFDMGGASALIVFFTTLLFAMIFRTAYDRTTIYIRSNPLKSGAEKEKS